MNLLAQNVGSGIVGASARYILPPSHRSYCLLGFMLCFAPFITLKTSLTSYCNGHSKEKKNCDNKLKPEVRLDGVDTISPVLE